MNQTADNRKYWHEISQEEVYKLIDENRTIGYIMENYKQPDWCNYKDALSFNFGCWSLCDIMKNGTRTKISTEFCKNCECFNNKKKQ
jgi:hypothetical protein